VKQTRAVIVDSVLAANVFKPDRAKPAGPFWKAARILEKTFKIHLFTALNHAWDLKSCVQMTWLHA